MKLRWFKIRKIENLDGKVFGDWLALERDFLAENDYKLIRIPYQDFDILNVEYMRGVLNE